MSKTIMVLLLGLLLLAGCSSRETVVNEPEIAGRPRIFSPGPVGYSLPVGTVKPGEPVTLRLFLQDGEAGQSGPVEYSLHRLDVVDGRQAVITQENVASLAKKLHFTVTLPEEAPAVYRIAAAVYDSEGLILDELVGYLYVPPQELNARMALDKNTFRSGETALLTIHNDGPTRLLFGEPYAVEKSSGGAWIPDDLTLQHWVDAGMFVFPGETSDQAVDLTGALPGRYRVSKEVRAEGTPLSRILYAEFEVR